MTASFGWTPPSARRSELPLDRRARLLWVLVGLTATALLLATARTAWVCDDAWFSLRSAWNLVHGYGLVFNPGERVQAFTSPLWTITSALPMVVGVPGYVAVLILSGLCTLGLAVLLVRHGAPGPGGAALALAMLAGSKAFVDYSASGLENPLIRVLSLGFLIRWSRDPKLHPRALGLLAGLLVLTRPDLVLLVVPHLAWLLLGRRGLRRLGWLLVGGLPLLLWELFSIAYYGSPVPSTAFAKLGDAGLPQGFLLERGLAYLWEPMVWDYLTVPLIALGLLLAFLGPRRTTLPTAAGVALYLAYVVWIGGDFMAGRFLAAPLLGAAFVLAWLPWWRWPAATLPAVAVVAAAAALRPSPPSVLANSDYQATLEERGYQTAHQVADERLVYLPDFGLVARVNRMSSLHDEVDGPHDLIVFEEVAGHNAYIAGPGCHVVNPYGLSDAFIARMPADPQGQERAGHVTRHIPSRYLDSIRAGENLLEDPEQRALLDDVWLATRAPLLTPERAGAILRLHGLNG